MRKSFILALLIALLAGGWVLSGSLGTRLATGAPDARPETEAQAPLPPAERLTTVRIARSTAEPRAQMVTLRGRTEAKRRVHLKAEIAGTVVELPKAKGERIRQGEVIARLAVEERSARLAEARALVRQRELEYQASKSLAEKGYRAETAFAANAAQLDAARAAVKAMEVQIEKTEIRAPFDAVIDDRMVEVGDFVKDASPIALLIDEDPFLIVGQVAESDVGRLTVGDSGGARLITGEEVVGTVRFIATAADPATRTFRVELEVANPDRVLRDGMTAEIAFPVAAVPAHFISPALLTLDDAGTVGVRTVGPPDADGRRTVAFHAVRLVADQADGVWVAGLPSEVDLITVGQEYVREGEPVLVGASVAGAD